MLNLDFGFYILYFMLLVFMFFILYVISDEKKFFKVHFFRSSIFIFLTLSIVFSFAYITMPSFGGLPTGIIMSNLDGSKITVKDYIEIDIPGDKIPDLKKITSDIQKNNGTIIPIYIQRFGGEPLTLTEGCILPYGSDESNENCLYFNLPNSNLDKLNSDLSGYLYVKHKAKIDGEGDIYGIRLVNRSYYDYYSSKYELIFSASILIVTYVFLMKISYFLTKLFYSYKEDHELYIEMINRKTFLCITSICFLTILFVSR